MVSRRKLVETGLAGVVGAAGFVVSQQIFASSSTNSHKIIKPSKSAGDFEVDEPEIYHYDTRYKETFGQFFMPKMKQNKSIPLLVLIHGGGWETPTNLEAVYPVAMDLATAGVAVWNIDYREVGDGGGWPETVQDVWKAVNFVTELKQKYPTLDVQNTYICGHSSGGHLAAWVFAYYNKVSKYVYGWSFKSLVTLAGVFDLAWAKMIGHDRYVQNFLDGFMPYQNPLIYREASPFYMLPFNREFVCVHGLDDLIVSPEQSINLVDRAKTLGDNATLALIPKADHNDLVNVSRPYWLTVRKIILSRITQAELPD